MTDQPLTLDQATADLAPATRAKIEEAGKALEQLQADVTQREWLQITRALDRTRQEVITDGALRLLALAWVKEKRDHGGADWNRLLDLTDEALLELHGFPTDDDQADQAGEADGQE